MGKRRNQAGKGDQRRPCQISEREAKLRWALAFGKITREEFDKVMKEYKNEKV
jgi:hypothetical protein